MISPELLRHYPFFSLLDDAQLQAIAMIAKEEYIDEGTLLLKEGDPAEALYFLLEGNVDLYYTTENIKQPETGRGIPVGEINPGEPFSISALIEPYILTSTVYSSRPSRVIKIEAPDLRALFELDRRLGTTFMDNVSQAAMERLNATRTQLAAAWAQ